MATKIVGESIKSATSLKLGEIFGQSTIRYKESVINVEYPHFFIAQPNLENRHVGKTRMQLDYLMNIRYRVASDTQTVSNLEQKLDEIGFILCTELQTLDLGRPVKTRNRRYEKVDGVLHFFFEVTVFAYPEQPEEVKQQQYKLNEEVL